MHTVKRDTHVTICFWQARSLCDVVVILRNSVFNKVDVRISRVGNIVGSMPMIDQMSPSGIAVFIGPAILDDHE